MYAIEKEKIQMPKESVMKDGSNKRIKCTWRGTELNQLKRMLDADVDKTMIAEALGRTIAGIDVGCAKISKLLETQKSLRVCTRKRKTMTKK